MISKHWTILFFALIVLTPKSGMSEAQIHNITGQVQVYNYTTHAYSIEQKDKGVRFSFVASGNDSLAIIVDTTSGQGNYYKTIDFYGTDQTFTTPAGSRNGNSTVVFPFKPSSGQSYYFIVRPQTTSAYNYDFKVYIGARCTVTVAVDGNGTTVPSSESPFLTWTNLPVPLQAKATSISYFTVWSTTDSLEDSTSASTKLFPSVTNVTATARFELKPIHEITFIRDTLNFQLDGKDSLGVLFRFTAPSPDSFYITLSRGDNIYYPGFRLTYYKTDSTFSTAESLTSTYTEFHFSASESNQNHYFRIRPYYSSDIPASFAVKADSFYTLIVLPDSIGTVNPVDTFLMRSSTNKNISVTVPGRLYSFEKWQIVSGNARFGDSLSSSTTVYIDSNDATVKAVVSKKTIYDIGADPDTFQFATHGSYASGGVLLCFTASTADSFFLDVRKGVSYSNYIYYYGQDSTFSHQISYNTNSGYTGSFPFASQNPGEKHYFRIVPRYSSNSNDEFITQVQTYYTMTVEKDYSGTVSTDTTYFIRGGIPQSLPLPKYSSRYYFSHWSLISGSATLADSTDSLTTITANSNTTVRAVFSLRPVHEITENWDTVSYLDVVGGTRGGILFSFTAESSDSFCVEMFRVGNYTVRILVYDTLSSCSTWVDWSGVDSRFTFRADSGETRYYRVYPYYPKDTTASIRVRYYQYHNLTIKKELAGVLSSDTLSRTIRSNEKTIIDTLAAPGKYYFDHWEVVSGTATFANPSRPRDSITVHSDVVVKAVYLERPVQPLGFTWDTLGYQDIEGGTRGGILFSYTSTGADTFIVALDRNPTSHNKWLFYYGTDTSCSTIVWSYHTGFDLEYAFRTTEANQTVYFRVFPLYVSDTTKFISIRLFRYCKVYLTAENGAVDPADTVLVRENGAININTWPAPYSYYFTNWQIVSGNAVIGNASKQSTSLTVDSVDVIAEALYQPKTLYPITEYDSSYTFATNGGNSYCGGVIMSFTAPRADSFAIVLNQNNYSFNKVMYYYGTNSSFDSHIHSDTGYSTAFIFYASSPGETHYFRIAPENNGYDNDPYGFKIRYENINYIHFLAGTGGTVSPSGRVPAPDSVPVSDTARPASALYYFDRWETVAGNISYFSGDSTDSIISVAAVGGDAAMRAAFLPKTIYPLSNVDENFTFNVHGYPKGGVLLSYTTTDADSHALVINLPSSYHYNIDFFDTSSSFTDIVKTVQEILDYRYVFKSVKAGATYYFRINPTFASEYTKSFNIRVDTTVLLKITRDPGSSTVPLDSIKFIKGGTINLQANTTNTRNRFKVWRILSGSKEIFIADSTSPTTSVTANSDAHIHAIFEQKPVHQIDFTPDTFCYAVDGAPDNSGGILMKFVAPAKDTFVISFFTAGNNNSTNFFHHSDSTFVGVRRELLYNNENIQYGIRTSAVGETHYFRVEPSYSSDYDDSIGVRVLRFSTVELVTNGQGTTDPPDSIRVLQTMPYEITAQPASNYYQFWKWSVLDGNVQISDTNASQTTLIVTDTGYARVQANFKNYGINLIPKAPVQSLYHYDPDIPPGLFCSFRSVKADSFLLYVKHYNGTFAKSITFFGTHSHFASGSAVQTYNVNSLSDTLFKFKAEAADTNHYFRISPIGSYDDSLTIMWIPYLTLEVTCDGGGKVTPEAPVSKQFNDTVRIATTAIDPVFTFKHWTVAEGEATIHDSLSTSTWVRLSGEGDATVKAVYDIKPHDTLYIEDDSNGITVPLAMALVDTTKDTLVTAYPNSKWVFDKWKIISGNPVLSDTNNMSTRVKLNGTARIRACFKPDPNAKASLTINSITVQNHPEVEVIATLRDRSGKAIFGTDSVEFLLKQDSTSPDISVTNLSDVRGISVSLVIDRSYTMAFNNRMDTALVAAENFIDALSSDDRASIISFASSPWVEQAITDDKNLLKNGINKIAPDPSGETAIIDAANIGVEQLLNESNTRAVIIFSDGHENASLNNLGPIINYARENGVFIYSIAVGAEAFLEVDKSLRPLADSTDGYFFFARSTSELPELYQYIKKDIESRYLIRYVSPDKVIDGDTHTVYLSTEISGTQLSDSGIWIEVGRAPEITLTPQTIDLIEHKQPSNSALTITVRIEDDEQPVSVARISYRLVGSEEIITGDLTYLYDSNYQFTVPADKVNKPGIEFSITARDRHGLTASKGPFQINIDNDGPSIDHTPPEILKANQYITLKARVKDPDSVVQVLIYYKNNNMSEFSCDTMIRLPNDTFSVTVDGSVIIGKYVEYYIEARDKYLALTRSPSSGTNYEVNIDQPPKITYKGEKVWNEGDSVTGEITAVDPEGENVSLVLISKLPQDAFCNLVSPGKMKLGWKTGPTSNGEYRFIFRASDESYTVVDTIILTINDQNLLPEVIAPATCNITEGDTLDTLIFGMDPDKEIVQFAIESLPSEALRLIPVSSNVDTTRARLFWATGSNDAGTYRLIISASDGTNKVLDTIDIIVKDSSFHAPVVHASTKDTVIASGKEVVIHIWATDEDNSIPSLKLIGLPEGAKFTKNTQGDSGVFKWTASSGASELVLTAIAYDKVDVTQSDTLYIKLAIAQYRAAAALLDTNGNGFLDKIRFTWEGNAYLKETLPQAGEWIDSAVIRLLDGTYQKLEPLRIVRIDSVNAVVILKEKTGALQTGYRSAKIYLKDYPVTKQALPTVLSSIKDEAGPVIKRAVYYPGVRELNDRKKLTVYFSEPVAWPQVETRPADFLNYHRIGKVDNSIFTSLDAVGTSSRDSVIIYLDYEAQVSVLKDSLSLRPFADDQRTHLKDTTEWGNLPHTNNRKVPILLENAPVNLIATVCDTNGEGHIDRIILTVPAEYSIPSTLPKVNSAVSSITVHPWDEKEKRKLKPVKLEKSANSRQMIITIEENSSAGLETGWHSFEIIIDSTFVSGEQMPFKVSEVRDSAGPVISRVISYSVSLTAQNENDTLEVRFSEPVLWTQQKPLLNQLFNFYTKNIAGRKEKPFEGLSINSLIRSDSVSVKLIMDNGFRFKPNTDSLNIMVDWSKNSAQVTDFSGSLPHKNNRKVLVEYRGHEEFSVTICPNPYDPTIPQNNGLGKPGIAIIVVCDTLATQYKGNVTIFDAVGNIVLRNKKMNPGVSNDFWLSYVWDAKDEKRQQVGRGVYYVNIEITDKNGKKSKFGEKVGVIRVPRR